VNWWTFHMPLFTGRFFGEPARARKSGLQLDLPRWNGTALSKAAPRNGRFWLRRPSFIPSGGTTAKFLFLQSPSAFLRSLLEERQSHHSSATDISVLATAFR